VNRTEACTVCGEALSYLQEAADVVCSVCGRSDRGHVLCPEGHYVCEECHGAGFLGRLPALLAEAEDADPFAVAERLMAADDLPMLGCEHAQIAAGALMTALRNRGDVGVTARHVEEACERTSRQAVSAYCGLSGVCGVVPALGACYSVLVGGQCGKGPETQGAMRLVSRLAAATAEEAEPGCCKAYVRRCLHETAAFLDAELGIRFPDPVTAVCHDSDRHPHGCRGVPCEWHPDHPRDSKSTHLSESEPLMSVSTHRDAQERYDQFFALAYADGALTAKTKILVSLGASLASGCAP
jgi:hypothetical protein